MTKKRFTLIDMNNIEKELLSPIKDNGSDCLTWFEVVECLNALHEENVKLQARNKYLATKIQRERNSHIKQHEKWEKEIQKENEELKTIRSDLISELDIVQNELNIAIDKGFAPSKPYKNYMASKKTEYDKFWENKIKTHNNTLKELKE